MASPTLNADVAQGADRGGVGPGELEVAAGRGGDGRRTGRPLQDGQIAVDDAGAVGEEHVRVEDAGAFQDLDRGDAVAGEARLGLVAVLGGVEVHGQAVFAGEPGGGGEVGVADRVRGVRGEGGGDAAVGEAAVPQRELQ
ncbi:hypothetical protein SAFG77S_12473 [Streptomyces afghaniensis]